MRVLMITIILGMVTLFAGCGAEWTAGGAGLAGGFTASEMLKGLQVDLERRQNALIEHYNQLVAAGAKAETLEDVKQQIADNQKLQQGAGTISEVAKTNWSDPKAAGGAVGTILALAYALFKRKDLNNTIAGVKAFRAKADETTKHQLDQVLLEKKAAT